MTTNEEDDLDPLDAEWLAEISRRWKEFETGNVQLIPWEEVRRSAIGRRLNESGNTMSTVPTRLLTPAEYLQRERAAEFRSEFYRGEMFAMAGASWEHTLIKDNFAAEIRNQLRGGPCRVATSDLRVKVDVTGWYTYPDLLVVCDEPQF